MRDESDNVVIVSLEQAISLTDTRYLMSVETFSEILEFTQQFEDSVQGLGKISFVDAENCEDDESTDEDLEEHPAEECEAAAILTYQDHRQRKERGDR